MTINGTLAETVKKALSGDTSFNDVTFVIAYENDIKPTPVSKPIVAVSVKECKVGKKLKEYLDSGLPVTTNKREVYTTVSTDIYLPYSSGGNAGHKLYDRIATFLLYTKDYNITASSCAKAEYDGSCEAIVLRAQFTFKNTVSA